MMKDYYYILGVDANCNAGDIKDAYHKLSKKYHPDLNHNDTYFENRFKEIQEAYEVLSDPKQRKRYDEFYLHKTFSPNFEPSKQRRYPRTTAIDIIFTLILIGITVLFGKYVIASITGHPKAAIVSKTITDTPEIVVTAVEHHKKKKHHIIVAESIPNVKPAISNTAKKLPPRQPKNMASISKISPGGIKTDTAKPKLIAIANQPVAPVQANNAPDNDIPYSSYLRSNLTGVVNMHKSDKLNSDIVAVIPSHTKVLVLQKGDSYYKVQFNGDEGYVPKWTVLTK